MEFGKGKLNIFPIQTVNEMANVEQLFTSSCFTKIAVIHYNFYLYSIYFMGMQKLSKQNFSRWVLQNVWENTKIVIQQFQT